MYSRFFFFKWALRIYHYGVNLFPKPWDFYFSWPSVICLASSLSSLTLKTKNTKAACLGTIGHFGASVTSAWKDWTGQKVHLLPFLWFIQLLLPCWQDHHFKAQQTVTFGCLRFFQSCKYDRIRNKLAFVTLLHGLGVFSANSLVNWHIIKNKNS